MEKATELVERVREHYVRQFLAFVEGQRKEWGSGAAEVKFQLSDQASVFRSLYCVDFATKNEDEAVVRELLPDLILTFEPLRCQIRSTIVVFERLVWDDVEVHHDATQVMNDSLNQWFDYWFDLEENRYEPNADVGGIIHSLSVDRAKMNVDFGTASTEALWDLLDLVVAGGASSVRLTSSREAA